MDCKVKRPRRWTRPKPGSKGAVHFRYASLAGISSATARDHFRTRTYAEPPHLTAEVLHRCVCIDDAEQLPGRQYIYDTTDANRKQWLQYPYLS